MGILVSAGLVQSQKFRSAHPAPEAIWVLRTGPVVVFAVANQPAPGRPRTFPRLGPGARSQFSKAHLAPSGRMHTRVYRNGVLDQQDFDPALVSDFLDEGDCVVWLDLCTTQGDQLALISDELKLDTLAVEDAINRRQRPKVDRYPDHLFLTAYVAQVGDDPDDLDLSEVSIFVTERALVTVHDNAFHPEQLTARWDAAPDVAANGVGGLLHGLLDLVVDSHFTATQQLDDEVEDLEDLLFANEPHPHMQQRMFALRKTLVRLRRVVLPMREVMNTLLRRDLHVVTEAVAANYQDVYDHALRASEWTEGLRDMVSTIFETHLSMQDHRLNNVMKKLAAWAAIISVPTAVTGYFGQNVPYPGFGTEWGFWVSAGGMVAIGAVLYGVFRRRDWI
ncbi:magnesium transporter CorA family protein [Terrabacter sp. BE26]|uniref:magnesium transporter CorA family protein n=1 Tax=Terrabacter sp. BE26 TaxID=2898152 RepID=UPI0035BE211C